MASGIALLSSCELGLATPRPIEAGKPRPSDVIFSARSMVPESIPIAVAARTTRFDWLYSEKGSFLAAVRNAGIATIGGAINMWPSDAPNLPTYRVGRALSSTGGLIEAPWARGMGLYWGCVNNPDFMGIQLGRAMRTLSAGANAIQFDDAAAAIPAVGFGACWCPYCQKLAASSGYDLRTSMLEFQTASTLRFIQALRASINTARGSEVLMSCNNAGLKRDEPYNLFDYGMCEIDPPRADIRVLERAYRQFELDGWMQVVTLRSRDIGLNRATIAAVHALGGAMIFPYNVYMSAGARFSANPDDVLALYHFVRAIGPLLDASRFTDIPPVALLTSDSMASLAQAGVSPIVRRAGDRTLLHLIPGASTRRASLLDIQLAAAPAATLCSAEQAQLRSVANGKLRIAPWDWSLVTIAI